MANSIDQNTRLNWYPDKDSNVVKATLCIKVTSNVLLSRTPFPNFDTEISGAFKL